MEIIYSYSPPFIQRLRTCRFWAYIPILAILNFFIICALYYNFHDGMNDLTEVGLCMMGVFTFFFFIFLVCRIYRAIPYKFTVIKKDSNLYLKHRRKMYQFQLLYEMVPKALGILGLRVYGYEIKFENGYRFVGFYTEDDFEEFKDLISQASRTKRPFCIMNTPAGNINKEFL